MLFYYDTSVMSIRLEESANRMQSYIDQKQLHSISTEVP